MATQYGSTLIFTWSVVPRVSDPYPGDLVGSGFVQDKSSCPDPVWISRLISNLPLLMYSLCIKNYIDVHMEKEINNGEFYDIGSGSIPDVFFELQTRIRFLFRRSDTDSGLDPVFLTAESGSCIFLLRIRSGFCFSWRSDMDPVFFIPESGEDPNFSARWIVFFFSLESGPDPVFPDDRIWILFFPLKIGWGS